MGLHERVCVWTDGVWGCVYGTEYCFCVVMPRFAGRAWWGAVRYGFRLTCAGMAIVLAMIARSFTGENIQRWF